MASEPSLGPALHWLSRRLCCEPATLLPPAPGKVLIKIRNKRGPSATRLRRFFSAFVGFALHLGDPSRTHTLGRPKSRRRPPCSPSCLGRPEERDPLERAQSSTSSSSSPISDASSTPTYIHLCQARSPARLRLNHHVIANGI